MLKDIVVIIPDTCYLKKQQYDYIISRLKVNCLARARLDQALEDSEEIQFV